MVVGPVVKGPERPKWQQFSIQSVVQNKRKMNLALSNGLKQKDRRFVWKGAKDRRVVVKAEVVFLEEEEEEEWER